ncbi:hypothetical protein GCM10022296_02660 [Secundilactobacillus similis DSM 23365 = JCM 2765]|uniref:Uncharacterized protein n=1 Tax=Secundilactobacillus similis DSM 23365 = JCM 2765 TaxID=1423804 RepID=A0A0R2EZ19_9LACO|nr:hypothetical protein FD14_GL001027 [Secundilactobacillus similis DSM 23365 = JCM 2765]
MSDSIVLNAYMVGLGGIINVEERCAIVMGKVTIDAAKLATRVSLGKLALAKRQLA